MRMAIALALMAVLVAGCDAEPATAPSVSEATTSEASPTPAPTSSPSAYDPFERWVELGGPELYDADGGGPPLSRSDAQARAYLGCGTTWAPGTVDALLAEAYRALEGFCP